MASSHTKATISKKGLKKGSRAYMEWAKERALEIWREHPTLTWDDVARDLGLTRNGFLNYQARDKEWYRKVQAIRAVAVGGLEAPDPGHFAEFRAKYLSVSEENPITLRTQDIGITYPFMEPLVDALSDPEVRRVLAIWPVRHGKTKILEQLVVYTLCKNPNARILYVCGSEGLAKDRIYAIQQMLTDDRLYPALHAVWGPWISKSDDRSMRWGALSFYVRGRTSTERDPSVKGVGITGKILGARADLIILDDVDDPTNSSEQRRKIMRAINTTLRTRLNDGGKVVCIGNRCGHDDVYSQLMERKGWVLDIQGAYTEEGKPLCPEMYSADELRELAEDMTPEEFQMMMLNNPTPDGTSMFGVDLVDMSKGPFTDAPDAWERILSLDPARSETAGLVVIAHNRTTGEMRVIDCEAKRNPRHDGLFEMLQRHMARHHPSTVVIEEQGGSQVFTDVPYVQRFILEEGARMVRFTTGKNKHDPGVGMGLVAAKMASGKLQIAWGDLDSQRRMKPLCDDLLGWRPRATSHHGSHWDLAMALWFAVNTLNTQRSRPRAPIMDPLAAKRPWMRGTPASRYDSMKPELTVNGRRLG